MRSLRPGTFGLWFVLGFALATNSQEPSTTALVHVTIINRNGLASQSDETLVMAGQRVIAEGPANSIKLPTGARVIDGRGKFLVPGLWDMHVHVAGLTADPSWSQQVLLPLLLANGIVGIRDMGGDINTLLSWQRREQAGTLLSPAIIASGPFLVAGGKKTRDQIPVATPDEARAAVREIKASGANFVKIISLPSREVFFAVAEESKRQNIPFVGHLPLAISALEASSAGMRGIEHIFYSGLSLSVSSKEAELRPRLVEAEAKHDYAAWESVLHEADATYSPEKAAALARAFRKNGTWLTPTLASVAIASHPAEWNEDDPNLAFLPSLVATEFRNSANDVSVKRQAGWLARQSVSDGKLAAALFHAGVPLLAGSDSLDPFVFPGDSLHRELAELVRAGLTPLEALQTATSAPEEFLRGGGAIPTGKDPASANFVLLTADPLADINNTRKIWAVLYRGQFLDRPQLDAILAQAHSAAAAVK